MDPVAFVKRHGVVLASARGPVPNLAEKIAGAPISGSWWSHPSGKQIFSALTRVGDSPDVVALKLIEGKITFVHRRLWPALVRLSRELGAKRLTAIVQEHTPSGAHRNRTISFPRWVGAKERERAKQLSAEEAHALLGDWCTVGE